MSDTIGRKLDEALMAAFPDTDQGHPQTPLTRRVADIMAQVAMDLAMEGFPNIYFYNFHQTAHGVQFCRGETCEDGSLWVSQHGVSNEKLNSLSDTGIARDNLRFHLAEKEGRIEYRKTDDGNALEAVILERE